MYTADFDIGGTFTDGFFTCGAEIRTAKVLTTPHDLTECFINCMGEGAAGFGVPLAQFLRQCSVVRLSTTLGTNTLIQRRGPAVGLLVAKGQENRLYGSGPAALLSLCLKPELVVGVGADPQRDEVLAALRSLVHAGARIIAVSLPGEEAERRIRDIMRDRYPPHYMRSIPLQLSHEVSVSDDPHARTNTVVVNAYLHGELARGLFRAEDLARDEGLARPLLVVHAGGGCARVAKTVAVDTLSSGPAVAVSGAAALAKLLGLPRVITADMGGTSLDIAVLDGRGLPFEETPSVAGVRLAVPMIHTESIGAGGGSIAKAVNGRVAVGPDSAGSVPGPACYDKGGMEPTVTDANLLLGLVDGDRFLGGRMRLSTKRAEDAVKRRLARPLGREVTDLAAEIRRRVNEGMADCIRERVAEPKLFTMFAFGGGGPLHACGIAELVGIRRVVGFPFGSVFSAFGSSTVDIRHRYRGQDEEELRRQAILDMRGEGFAASDVVFDQRRDSGLAVLEARAAIPHWFPQASEIGKRDLPRSRSSRSVLWETRPGAVETAIFRLEDLMPGNEVQGPAIIEADHTSYAVYPSWMGRIDAFGNVVMERML
jgi:N-methylhydantoinase A/oxoprolinase/acetone carboxylase beta subunit